MRISARGVSQPGTSRSCSGSRHSPTLASPSPWARSCLGTLNRSDWAGVFTGPAPAPRAWDNLFFGKPEGWIRLRLNSGAWLGGGYAEAESGMKSYAAGYPEDPDLLLAEAVETDPDTGEFMFDDEGDPILRGSALLVRWEEVEYLEFIDV